MRWGSGRSQPAVEQGSAPGPRFIVELQPRYREFFSNLTAALSPPSALPGVATAPFWDDVFVHSQVPWGKLLQSAFYHVVCVTAVLGWLQLAPQRTVVKAPPVFQRSDVITYAASDYLPEVNTGSIRPARPRKGDPAKAAQEIISVPPEADNRRQTVVAVPEIKLNRDIPVPNVVALARVPLPTPPITATTELKLAQLAIPVIAPPPEVPKIQTRQAPGLAQIPIAPSPQVRADFRQAAAPEPAVVEPPPSVATALIRTPGSLSIGPSDVVAPAPQLPVAEQRVFARGGKVVSASALPEAIPPAPAVAGATAAQAGRQLIVLNVAPVAPPAHIDIPRGTRRGEFAATPQGLVGAAGTPESPTGSDSGAVSTPGDNARSRDWANVPPGIFVGAAPKPAQSSGGGSGGGNAFGSATSADKNRLIASAIPPRTTTVHRPREVPDEKVTDVERRVFHDRKLYSMMLNLPNLNSAGGSWVMHFAELHEPQRNGELTAPIPTQAVDPAYPTELMRDNIQGTVTLYAVIHSDGSVSDVRVLQGVDDRLDQYASIALRRWHFRPATKNGNAVPLEAVVSIPFRSSHREF